MSQRYIIQEFLENFARTNATSGGDLATKKHVLGERKDVLKPRLRVKRGKVECNYEVVVPLRKTEDSLLVNDPFRRFKEQTNFITIRERRYMTQFYPVRVSRDKSPSSFIANR